MASLAPSMGEVKNLNSKIQIIIKRVPVRGCPIRALHIPESLGSESGGQLSVRDRGNGLKTQPVVYRWTNGAGWVNPTSYEVMRMKAVNHKPMIRLKGTLAL